ncbi:Golgi-associated plant pathogenesis-related protein 1 [Stylophora pistillata]|uniref:Golgi-associated plant pathogenesis-related protein 1 n=1 Tax=Stylophora pistillata TaxID=50429 RepID=A0A2B4RTP3_STYPI|nr:Golgi-associated plant pathogenesis-related protein 1 [Stylophora pistillata]
MASLLCLMGLLLVGFASANLEAAQNEVKTADSKTAEGTGQATGRAILLHSANGVGHVVQDSPSGKSPVIVINSEAAADNGGKLDPFSQDCLDAHNNYRAKHGVPPLMWSRDLAEGAQNWADQLASTDSLQHDEVAIQNRKMGENLAYFQPAVPKCEGAMVDNCVNCREMVQRWYDEIKNYDFDKGGPKAARGAYKHFSQLIWANTAELGVGTAVSKRYGFITVARYRPTGNDGGFEEFIRNVPPEGGPLPTLSSPLQDNSKREGDVKMSSSSEKSAVSSETTTNSVAPQSANRHSSTADKNQSNTPTVTSGAAVLSKGAKLGNEPTPVQPMNKEQHRKGGFVHTLTANDGTRAQVYLSRNGAHAGIVFRNEISRVAPDEDTTGVKRTIKVL